MYTHTHVHKYLCVYVQCNSLDMCPIHTALRCSLLKIITHQGHCTYTAEYIHSYGTIQNAFEYTPTHSPTWERKEVFIVFRLRWKDFWFVVLIYLYIKIWHSITYKMRYVRYVCINTYNFPSVCGITLYNEVLICRFIHLPYSLVLAFYQY